ncbi:MAG: SelB C-terminal domain-containing protein [Lautropia sp.]|nr:SelB C-terminal domain-containing protein [Lautropia sp.]
MIVGTAGHIDHGKSTLVKVLTGVETDRLPEERRRGMSIELGYAFMPVEEAASADRGAVAARLPDTVSPRTSLPAAVGRTSSRSDSPADHHIGFIDVPGHEKLVHTMIAGVTGIDFALLLVAADDGVMPQTREHLAVLSLLGIDRGAVVLTKVDRVGPVRVREVRLEIENLLQHTCLQGAPILPVSAVTGEGMEALRVLLRVEARRLLALESACERPAQMHSLGREGTPTAGSGQVNVSHGFGGGTDNRRSMDDGGEPDADSGESWVSGVEIGWETKVTAVSLASMGFRLAIDRVFSLEGTGTVVTGTVHAGTVSVGDQVDQTPGGLHGIRVRSLHAQNQKTGRAHAGQRCAMGLVGIEREALQRGQWLVQPGLAVASDRIDIELRLWPGEQRALRSGMQVHVHLGAAMSTASVAVLDRQTLPPGQCGLVQLVLHRPLAAWYGDRLILRDASGQRVLAGGRVLDIRAPVRYRRTRQRLQLLAALQQPSLAARLDGMLASLEGGLSLSDWRQRLGLASIEVFGPALAEIPHRRLNADLVMGEAAWQRLRARVLEVLREFHQQSPDELGPDAARLRRLTRTRIEESSWGAVLDSLLETGDVCLGGAFVHLPEQGVELAARDEALVGRIMPALQTAGAQGAWLRDLAVLAGEQPGPMRAAMGRLARSGRVYQIVKDLYQDEATTTALGRLFRRLIGAQAEQDGRDGPQDASARALLVQHPSSGQARNRQSVAERVQSAGTRTGADVRQHTSRFSTVSQANRDTDEPRYGPDAGRSAVTVAQFRDASGLGRKRAVQVLEFFDRIGLCRRVGDQHLLRPESRLFLDE